MSFVGIHHFAIKGRVPRLGRYIELLNHTGVVAVTIRDVACDKDDLFIVGIIKANDRPANLPRVFDPKH